MHLVFIMGGEKKKKAHPAYIKWIEKDNIMFSYGNKYLNEINLIERESQER